MIQPASLTRWWERSGLGQTVLVALTVAFGLQLLRMMLAELVFYLRDSLGAAAPLTGVCALGVFSLAFLAPYTRRFLGPKGALLLTAGGVASVRLAEQVVHLPAADLALASLGTALFLMFVPIYLLHPQERDQRRGQQLALGLLLGLALDTTLKGMFATLDLSWQSGTTVHAVVAFLVGLHWLLLAAMVRRHQALSNGGGISRPTLLLALGPVLFLELLLFQNVGQQTALINWSQPVVFLWLAAANAVGIAAATGVMMRPSYGSPLTVAALAGLFVFLSFGERTGAAAALVALYGQAALAMSVGIIGVELGAGATNASLGRVFLASGLGLLLLLLLTFLYYVDYVIPIPGGNRVVLLLSVAVLFLAVSQTLSLRSQHNAWRQSWTPAAASVLLLVLPLGYLLAWEGSETSVLGNYPVRVMSYNLHQGFGVDGVLAIARQADVIKEQRPDIVALQEVSRGWVLDGSFDMLVWLSRRLDMPYVWSPAADSVWGNAILSRYPVFNTRTYPMPNNSQIAMQRSFTKVRIDLADGEPLTVIASHLHHVTGENRIREEQVRALVKAWSDAPRTVILGDFNATPDSPEIHLLSNAGLKDAFVATSPASNVPETNRTGMQHRRASGETGSGYTAPSVNPTRRIDYIWVSSDLNVQDFSITGGHASDHLGVAATLYP